MGCLLKERQLDSRIMSVHFVISIIKSKATCCPVPHKEKFDRNYSLVRLGAYTLIAFVFALFSKETSDLNISFEDLEYLLLLVSWFFFVFHYSKDDVKWSIYLSTAYVACVFATPICSLLAFLDHFSHSHLLELGQP